MHVWTTEPTLDKSRRLGEEDVGGPVVLLSVHLHMLYPVCGLIHTSLLLCATACEPVLNMPSCGIVVAYIPVPTHAHQQAILHVYECLECIFIIVYL